MKDIGMVTKQAVIGGSVGHISGSWIDKSWAKALEILGPGTVTRDQVAAIAETAVTEHAREQEALRGPQG